jgi:polyisoprenoid-binding protein YceI
MKRWMKFAIAAVIAAPILWFGGILVYAKVINKADETAESQFADLAEAASQATVASAAPTTAATATPDSTAASATTDPSATTAAPAAAEPVTSAATASPLEGNWTVDGTSEIFVGYRVEEVLSGINTTATGRSNQVTGAAVVTGTTLESAEFTVDVASITSDQSRRDNQFRGRIMETETYPTATFTLTQPVVLDGVPAEGQVITATVIGNLTLHGVTKEVTFDLQAFHAGGKITVTGAIPILFADYAIEDPSLGPVSTEDNGLLEFLLVMAKV